MEHSPTITFNTNNEASKDDSEHDLLSRTVSEDGESERKLQLLPRFWAACLASYNNGILHGEWINANQPSDAIHGDIQNMLQQSPIRGAEEFAIHDHENFGPIRLSEYESICTVSRIGMGLAEHGEAFGHWAECVGTDSDQLDDFEEHYLGCWASLADYAEHLLDDLGETEDKLGPAWLRPYIRVDYDGLGRDLGYDLRTSSGREGTYIFST